MKRSNQIKTVLLLLLLIAWTGSAWGKTVTLSWDASPSSVAGYRIYYDVNSSASPLEGTGATEGASPVDVGNVLSFTLNGLADADEHYFAVTAYDDAGNESAYSNTVYSAPVAASNVAPVLAAIGARSVLEGALLSFTVTATDADGDSLSLRADGLPAGAGFDAASGAFRWTPAANQAGQYPVTFSVSDGSASDSETVLITVTDVPDNRAPVLATIGNRSVNEGTTQAFSVRATDADGDNLTYSATNLPRGAVFDAAGGDFRWTPDYNQAGVYNVIFAVSDGSLKDSETVALTVVDVNRAPVLNPVGSKIVGEGLPLSFTVSAADPDNDALDYRAEGLPAGASFDSATRQFNWIPDYQSSENTRVYPVTFFVSDGAAEDSESITINVTNVNRAPVLTAIGTQSVTEGDSVNLVVSATDPDGNDLTYTAGNLPEGAVFTASTRSFSWIPGNDQSGSYQVVFRVSDGDLTDSETVTFNVANGNDAPLLATIGSRSVAEGDVLEITLSATDTAGDSLTFSASGMPEGATFSSTDRRFSWTPDFTQAGTFNVEFKVSDGRLDDSEVVAIRVTNTNRAPRIDGAPATSAMVTTAYRFAPTASDPDGDSLSFTIENKPSWAAFDSSNGLLSGVPAEANAGTFSDIRIHVSDGSLTTSLAPFTIAVAAYEPLDSDGDGVYDHLDAFPDDPSESLDTDGDRIGNNSDSDDDNDGVADIRDGFPLDPGKTGWVISAVAGTGGYLSPEGETTVLYGGSQQYEATPMTGYYLNDLLVDGISVGLSGQYSFDNIDSHHRIEAVFVPIPTGLSEDPTAQGLAGIERIDGGDDSNNLVDGLPKQNLDYRFSVTLREAVSADLRKVYLVLNGYKYEMALADGALSSGAEYAFTTRLGPVSSHRFYFSAEDSAAGQVWRYPANGELPGPVVELLNGRNVLGLALDINAYGLGAQEAFSEKIVYRWLPDSGPKGSFKLVDTGAPVSAGEGYVLKKAAGGTLPDLSVYGMIKDPVYEMQLKEGWNLISNPYGGNVALADIAVRRGAEQALPWLQAVADKLVVDVIYSYLGEDWGGDNEFSSAKGEKPAVLVPWIGYWIYVNPTSEPVSILIAQPMQ